MIAKIKAAVNNMSLRGKILTTIIASALIAVAFIVVMVSVTKTVIYNYFDDETKWMEKTDIKAAELQDYITQNDLSMDDWDALTAWNKKNPAVYLYLYTEDYTVYETSKSVVAYSYENYGMIRFSDGEVNLSIFYAIDYAYYTMALIIEIILSVLIFVGINLHLVNKIVEQISSLEKDVKILEGGGLDHVITVHGNDEIGSLERSLNDMRLALKDNIDREEELVRANSELVTRMAHDFRTPLTTINLYMGLIEKKTDKDDELLEYVSALKKTVGLIEKKADKDDELLEYVSALKKTVGLIEKKADKDDKLLEYVAILKKTVDRLWNMSDQLFERFLITSGRAEDSIQTLPVRYVFEDTLSFMIMDLENEGFKIYTDVSVPDMVIPVVSDYLQRILENAESNIRKYADRSKPVTISMNEEFTDLKAPDPAGSKTSKKKKNKTGEQDAADKERFLRLRISNYIGTRQSSEGGSNIGLENVAMMLEKMGGSLEVNDDGEIFELVITLPEAKQND